MNCVELKFCLGQLKMPILSKKVTRSYFQHCLHSCLPRADEIYFVFLAFLISSRMCKKAEYTVDTGWTGPEYRLEVPHQHLGNRWFVAVSKESNQKFQPCIFRGAEATKSNVWRLKAKSESHVESQSRLALNGQASIFDSIFFLAIWQVESATENNHLLCQWPSPTIPSRRSVLNFQVSIITFLRFMTCSMRIERKMCLEKIIVCCVAHNQFDNIHWSKVSSCCQEFWCIFS